MNTAPPLDNDIGPDPIPDVCRLCSFPQARRCRTYLEAAGGLPTTLRITPLQHALHHGSREIHTSNHSPSNGTAESFCGITHVGESPPGDGEEKAMAVVR